MATIRRTVLTTQTTQCLGGVVPCSQAAFAMHFATIGHFMHPRTRE